MTNIGISGCLGYNFCRYDGNKFDANEKQAKKFLKQQGINDPNFVKVCPEQMGGLSTPRVPSEIVGGTGKDVWKGTAKVINQQGKDVTKKFKLGAINTLQLAVKKDIKAFILKEKSPSCGSNLIYDGSFEGNKIPGKGVTVALLNMFGIKIYPDTKVWKEKLNSIKQELSISKK